MMSVIFLYNIESIIIPRNLIYNYNAMIGFLVYDFVDFVDFVGGVGGVGGVLLRMMN